MVATGNKVKCVPVGQSYHKSNSSSSSSSSSSVNKKNTTLVLLSLCSQYFLNHYKVG